MAKKVTINDLAQLIEKGFAAAKDDIADLKDEITDIRAAMVTKVDYHDLRQELRNVRTDLKELRENVENISGFRKEIDHALERIAAIEKHRGIQKKIAA